ncbi:MAG: hypothetical protein CSA50_00835 [Gammaproteobacteria bacterium]|nr:MAG: hypothetical protein CSA50_00835 [Gammaproteobacteria bacterium]
MKQRKFTLASAITVMLALIMLATLGYQGYQFGLELNQAELEQNRSNNNPSVPGLTPLATGSTRYQDLALAANILVDQHLFGTVANKSPQKPKEEIQTMPATRLKLILRGVSVADDPQFCTALIEGPDRKTEIYAIGADLPGNATLHQVYSDRIVINRKGLLEKLYFPEKSDPNAAHIASQNARQADTPPPTVLPAMPVRSSSSTRVSKNRKAKIKERLRALRQRAQIE